MINQTFLLFPSIGNKTDLKLKKQGFSSWEDCLSKPDKIPFGAEKKNKFLKFITECAAARQEKDIEFLVSKLPTSEHWRVLLEFFEEATFFDIETTGLSFYSSKTTVISAFHRKKLHSFVYNENLDDFLSLIDESKLLVTFNGGSFDIPFLSHSFNLPDLGCPHVDLRWISYHQGLTGGLKRIEKTLGINRSSDISEVNGYEAVMMFYQWQKGDRNARNRLIKYCEADVVSTYLVSGYLLEKMGYQLPSFHKIASSLINSK